MLIALSLSLLLSLSFLIQIRFIPLPFYNIHFSVFLSIFQQLRVLSSSISVFMYLYIVRYLLLRTVILDIYPPPPIISFQNHITQRTVGDACVTGHNPKQMSLSLTSLIIICMANYSTVFTVQLQSQNGCCHGNHGSASLFCIMRICLHL